VSEFLELRFEQLVPPELPIREAMDDDKLYELRDSIRALGILQPLIVYRVKVEHPAMYPDTPAGNLQAAEDARVRFEIIAGHRRYMAARMVPLDVLPCLVYDDSNVAKEAMLLAENLYREDITPIEEARFFSELIAKYDLTEDQLCRMVRQNPDYVYGRMKLLEYDAAIIDALRERKLSLAVAKELHRCPDEKHRAYLLDIALTGGLTATACRGMVNQFLQQPAQPGPSNGNGEAPFSYVEPSASPLVCIVCGGDKDPQNLAWVAVHKWEVEGFKRLIGAQQKLAGAV